MRHLPLSLLPALVLAGALSAQSFVVANRGAGNITVHAASDGSVQRTVDLPSGTNAPEPMYVVQVRGEVLVGDRANDRVVRFSKHDYSVAGTIPAGRGVFHMWAGKRQLWVNNDIDNTSTVVDTRTKKVLKTVPMPADLVSAGYKPHDVFVGRRYAWVSLLGGSANNDWVVQFDQRTFAEKRRAPVGKDPHLFWQARSHRLFVASQNGNQVTALQSDTLRELDRIPITGAHGIFLPAWSNTLLVTNITGGGTNDLVGVDISRRRLLPAAVQSTGVPTAHNIAATPFGLRILVTHSGATSDKVTLYQLERSGKWWWLPWGKRNLRKIAEVQAGTNPFGLAFVH